MLLLKKKKKSVKQFFSFGLLSKWQRHVSGSHDCQIKELIWILKTKCWMINRLFGVSSKSSFTFCVFQKLNSPTLSVNSEGFIPMLSKLDDCIEYVSSHVGIWQSFTSFCADLRQQEGITRRRITFVSSQSLWEPSVSLMYWLYMYCQYTSGNF